jgi:hypothetical protein
MSYSPGIDVMVLRAAVSNTTFKDLVFSKIERMK